MRARVATSDKRLPNHNNNIGFAKLQLCVLSHDIAQRRAAFDTVKTRYGLVID